jgi:hypothetical protein
MRQGALALSVVFCAFAASMSYAQQQLPTIEQWRVPTSSNRAPHFEVANGRKVLYVDGQPFTVLAVEIPWWDLIYGRYKQTETKYDRLYLAAAELGLNALKVPIKWSMVEPQQGTYDF